MKSIFLSLACLFAVTSPALAVDAEWVLTTAHDKTGRHIYYISQDAIKVDCIDNGAVMVARAPAWLVSCSRKQEKLEFKSPLKDFNLSAIFAMVQRKNPKPDGIQMLKGTENLKGLPCRRYITPDGDTCWTPVDLKVAPQIPELLARYFGKSNCAAVIVRQFNSRNAPAPKKAEFKAVPWMDYSSVDIHSDKNLTTDLISWKRVPYKASDFEYPKNYKQTKDVKDIIVSGRTRQVIKDLLEGTGYGDDQPESKSRK